MKIPYRNSGFSDRAENEGQRLLNKDGSYNVEKSGLTFFERFSLFHWLLNLKLYKFVIFLFCVYLIVNGVFAVLYMLCGEHAISGASQLNTTNHFLHCFFFSTQTITTVGYGALHPVSTAALIIASVESFAGLLGFAIATGLLYSRFARPKARIIFSKNALISPYKERKALMIRLANAKESQLTQLVASMTFSQLEDRDGEKFRRYYLMQLEIEKINVLATSWTLVHPIDDKSPIYGSNKSDLENAKAEIMLQIQAYDETYAQQIQTRTSFTAVEMIWDAKFVRILGHNDAGKATLNLEGLSSYEAV